MEKELNNLLSKPASYYVNLVLKVNPKFDFKKPVILFGAAILSSHFIKFFQEMGTQILYLSDNDKNKIGKELHGLKIIDKKTIKKEFGNKIQIIVSSVYYEEIIKDLKNMGFNNVFSPLLFFTVYHKKFDLLVWNNNINIIFKNKRKIKSVFLSLADQKSKKIFLGIIKFRLTFKTTILSHIIDNQNQYFDKNIIKLSPNEIFLDGGAYDGDTIKMFIKKSKNIFNKIYAFEPDDKSFILLNKYINTLSDERIRSFKIGLGKTKEKLHFTNEGNLQSKITDNGKILVRIFPIDNYKNIHFSYIKLDIEGFEKQALLGAKNVIHKYKPKLAICSYHKIEDLWEVPYMIKKMNNKCKLYFRHYSNFLFETICYSV